MLKVEHALLALETMDTPRCESFGQTLRRYTDFQSTHMDIEETEA